MQNDDRPRFAEGITQLADVFNETLTATRVSAYWHALEDLPIQAVRGAIEQAIRTCRFFPRPAEIRQLASANGPDLGEAYGAFARMLRNWRPGAQAPTPGLAMVVERMGGWRAVTDLSEEEQYARFQRLFVGVREACLVRGIPLIPGPTPLAPRLSRASEDEDRSAGRDVAALTAQIKRVPA